MRVALWSGPTDKGSTWRYN